MIKVTLLQLNLSDFGRGSQIGSLYFLGGMIMLLSAGRSPADRAIASGYRHQHVAAFRQSLEPPNVGLVDVIEPAKALKGHFKFHDPRRYILLSIHQGSSFRHECIEKTLSVPKLALEVV